MSAHRQRARADDGTVIPLIIVFALVASLLLLVVIDATVLFMNKRSIGTAADGAAVAAAQSIDKATLYSTGGIVNNQDLPLTADAAARHYLAAYDNDAHYPGMQVTVQVLPGNKVQVTVTAPSVHIPFGSFVGYPNGVSISDTATAVLRCGDAGHRTCG